MTLFAVTAVGADRPGIVASVTGTLVDQGCNLEDTSMSILRGHFAMVMIVAAPDRLAGSDLEEGLTAAASALGLVVSVRPVHDSHVGVVDAADGWTVVVYGADHPGIVHGVTRHLADAGVNVVDLTTRVTDADPPIYAMVMEVTLPGGVDPEDLRLGLDAVAAGLGVTCTLHPSEADIL